MILFLENKLCIQSLRKISMLQTKPEIPQDVKCYQLLNNFQRFFLLLRKNAANPQMGCSFRIFVSRLHNVNPWWFGTSPSLRVSCATLGGATNGQLVVWVPVVWDFLGGTPKRNPFHKGIIGMQTTGPQTTNLPLADNILAQNNMDRKDILRKSSGSRVMLKPLLSLYSEGPGYWLSACKLLPWPLLMRAFEGW